LIKNAVAGPAPAARQHIKRKQWESFPGDEPLEASLEPARISGSNVKIGDDNTDSITGFHSTCNQLQSVQMDQSNPQ
jgi:hypothetical protein